MKLTNLDNAQLYSLIIDIKTGGTPATTLDACYAEINARIDSYNAKAA